MAEETPKVFSPAGRTPAGFLLVVDDEPLDKQVYMKLPARLVDAVDGEADVAGVSRADAVTDALIRWLEGRGYELEGAQGGSPGTYLTAEEAARRLGIGLRSLRSYCAEGKLPAIKKNRHEWLISSRDLEDFAETLGPRPGPRPRL